MFLVFGWIQGWCPWCGDHMAGGGWGMMLGALREEYARGAIDEETYRRRLRELRRD